MANEAVIIELLGNGGDPVRFTCEDGFTIEKGSLLKLIDPRTVSGSNIVTTGTAFAGIAAAEKVASDGSTSIAAYTNGIFDLTLASTATCNAGDFVCMSGANLIREATEAELQLGAGIGKALETGSSGEVIAVRVLV